MGAEVLVLDGPAMLSQARGFVAEQLRRLALPDVITDAQIIVSELVTNVFLHTGGVARLAVVDHPDGARVEVRDSSTAPPVRTGPAGNAMTGRGLQLVESLAARWGVDALPDGKAVWAELRTGPAADEPSAGPLDEASLLAMWSDDELDLPARPQVQAIDLGTVPTRLLLDAKAHVDGLVREFTLIAGGSDSGMGDEVPEPVSRLIDVVVHGFAEPRKTLKRLAVQAAAGAHEEVGVVLDVPDDVPGTVAAGRAYLDALDQANAFCRAARLLTLESPPQHRVFHRWYVTEYIACLEALDDPTPRRPRRFAEHLLREIEVVATAHRLADQGARLQSLAVALSAALTPEAVARAVLDEGVTALGASGGVILLATDSETLGVPGAVGHTPDVMGRLRDEHPDAQLPAAEAMRTGEPVWLETVAERNARFPDLIGFEPATVAMCAVPVSLGDRRLGALRFSFAEARLFDDEERSFVTAMAAQTAQALHRAELYRQRQEISERLQATLLPARLPSIPGLDVAAAYHPLTHAMEVGGDFYDVWRCDETHWALAIGDVCGSGPEAAAVTGLVRHTLRALTATPLSISEILLRLNEALLEAAAADDDERFCTVTLGFVDLTDGGVTVELASGGHPDPMVVGPDGAEVVEVRGTLLGAVPDVVIDVQRVELAPGQTLVLVTDGATEARHGGAMLGVAGVAAAAASAPGDPHRMIAAIERAVRRQDGGRLRDDLALLALHRR